MDGGQRLLFQKLGFVAGRDRVRAIEATTSRKACCLSGAFVCDERGLPWVVFA